MIDDKAFEFEVIDFFILSNDQIAIAGYMIPDNIEFVSTEEYIIKLITSSGKTHTFKTLSEDRFIRSKPTNDNKRGLRTNDKIEQLLKDFRKDPVTIYGKKRKYSAKFELRDIKCT